MFYYPIKLSTNLPPKKKDQQNDKKEEIQTLPKWQEWILIYKQEKQKGWMPLNTPGQRMTHDTVSHISILLCVISHVSPFVGDP